MTKRQQKQIDIRHSLLLRLKRMNVLNPRAQIKCANFLFRQALRKMQEKY